MKKIEAVSVIIPCFNQARYLRDCLDSLRCSEFKSLEIIVINDGSTETGASEKIKSIISTFADLSIRLINQSNKGLSAVRNLGVEMASGEFIQFLDADDLVLPKKISLQVELFKKRPDLEVIVSDFLVSDDGLHYKSKLQPSTIKDLKLDFLSFLTDWEDHLSIPIHCGLFRRRVFYQIKFNEQLRAKEDWIFWTELVNHVKESAIFYFEDYSCIYRSSEKSMTKSNDLMLEARIKAQSFLLLKYASAINPDQKEYVLNRLGAIIKKNYLFQPKRTLKKKIKNMICSVPFVGSLLIDLVYALKGRVSKTS